MSKLRVNSQGQRSKVVSQRSEVKSQRWMVKSRSWKYHRVLLANSSKHSTDTTSYWTLMTSAQEVETSAIATDNSSLKESFCPDDQRSRLAIAPGFKPFTVLTLELISFNQVENASHHHAPHFDSAPRERFKPTSLPTSILLCLESWWGSLRQIKAYLHFK